MENNLSNIENQLLVMAAQEGDAEAMEKLVRRWYKKLWQYIFRLTSDRHVAWDISQQCWLEIIKGLNKLNEPACFKAWAYRIATNKSIDWLKNKRRNQPVNLDSIEVDWTKIKDDLLVQKLIQELKNGSKAVWGLYYVEKLSIAEISAVLKIPPGTVKSRLFKARFFQPGTRAAVAPAQRKDGVAVGPIAPGSDKLLKPRLRPLLFQREGHRGKYRRGRLRWARQATGFFCSTHRGGGRL